ncbi:hypothetical protein V6Z12_A07G178000 [Gossypium hirsutum]
MRRFRSVSVASTFNLLQVDTETLLFLHFSFAKIKTIDDTWMTIWV